MTSVGSQDTTGPMTRDELKDAGAFRHVFRLTEDIAVRQTQRFARFGSQTATNDRPGAYCEPKMTSVGSQDTTGPMTRDELKDLACLGFSADQARPTIFCAREKPRVLSATSFA
jgi:aconitase B